ncbi:hypothetical protein ACUOA8_28265, partial [Escherichia sp. SS-MK2]
MAFLTSSDKALWHLALPMIFSNITVPLLGLVDTAVIGHLDSPVYLGGVAVGATATSRRVKQSVSAKIACRISLAFRHVHH